MQADFAPSMKDVAMHIVQNIESCKTDTTWSMWEDHLIREVYCNYCMYEIVV